MSRSAIKLELKCVFNDAQDLGVDSGYPKKKKLNFFIFLKIKISFSSVAVYHIPLSY